MSEIPEARISELEALLESVQPGIVMDTIFSSTPSGALVARAPDGKILRVSEFSARIHGRPKSDLVGHTLADEFGPTLVFDPNGRFLPANERPLGRALAGEAVIGFELVVEQPDGERVPLISNAAPICNSRGAIIGAISSVTDTRPLKALEETLREALAQRDEALAQYEALYHELAHRVNNHLQIITALVSTNAKRTAVSAKDLASEVAGQIRTLAAVYRGLNRAGLGESVEARTFIEDVSRCYAIGAVSVDVIVAPSDLTLPPDQTGPVGMLLNEAVCNSYKHAFNDDGGRVQVSLRRLEPGRLRLEVADSGKGWVRDESLALHGLELMRLFANQLHSELELSDRPGGGAVVAAEFPEAAS